MRDFLSAFLNCSLLPFYLYYWDIKIIFRIYHHKHVFTSYESLQINQYLLLLLLLQCFQISSKIESKINLPLNRDREADLHFCF